jgi:hypothetical protein
MMWNDLVPDRAGQPVSLITPMMLADFTACYFLTMVPHTADLKLKLARYPAGTDDFWNILLPNSLIVLAGSAHRFWPTPRTALCPLASADRARGTLF